MKYVILGSTGFIGSSISRYLSSLPDTTCLGINSSNCDMLDKDACDAVLAPVLEGSVVIFAAGRHRMRSDSLQTMYDNISIVDNLVETFRKAPPSKMVFLSSVEVYGLAKQLPITERTPFEPETLYGIGKAASELVLKRWQRKSQGSLALLRLPGIYGPGDTSGGLIFHIVNSITEGRPFSLNGDGSDLRDYVFVEDVARIVAALGEEEFSELTLNLATGNSLSLVNILETAQQVFGPCEVQRGKRTQEAQDISFDTSELRKVLPNITMKTLREGFERTQDSLIEQRNDNV